MMPTDDELRHKRIYIAILSLAFLVAGLGMAAFPEHEGIQAVLLRVGLLLGALWLAMPSKDRPAAWANFSPWTIAGLIAVAAFLPRLKYVLPVVIAFAALAWLVRPRKKN